MLIRINNYKFKTMIKNLKNLYSQVIEKNKVVEILAREYDLSEETIKTNWFSKYLIHERYHKRIHEILINTLSAQMKKTDNMIHNKIDTTKLRSIVIGDVEMADRPDFSNAYLEEAYSIELDRWLTDDELEQVGDDFVNEYICENLDMYY